MAILYAGFPKGEVPDFLNRELARPCKDPALACVVVNQWERDDGTVTVVLGYRRKDAPPGEEKT